MIAKTEIPERMRVAMYYSNNDLRIQDMSVPDVGNNEILVKVIASGICGSDVMEWYRIKKAPLVLGHEIAGEIVRVGSDIKRYKDGDRVFVSHHVPCNTCKYCLDGHTSVCDMLRSTNFIPGGFSEYVKIPEINVDRGVFTIPDNLSYEEGVFIEPLACVYRGQVHSRMRVGKTVAVLGSGLTGLLHIQLARILGARKIYATDTKEYRLRMAKKFGADGVIDAKDDVPERIKDINNGVLADIVIVSTGAASAIEQSFRCVDRGGTILFFAPTDPGSIIRMPFNNLWRDEVTITTSYAGSPLDISIAIDLIHSKRIAVSDMITHRLPLADINLGFKLTAEASESVKVIIEPQR